MDEFGYLWSITDYMIEDANRRAAWVEWKRSEKDGGYEHHEYLLKARADLTCFKWKIETVNPYFGCFVHQLGWTGDSVMLVYKDKHSTFTATLDPQGEVRRASMELRGAKRAPQSSLSDCLNRWKQQADEKVAMIAMTTSPAPANALSPILIAMAVVSPTVSAMIATGRPTF